VFARRLDDEPLPSGISSIHRIGRGFIVAANACALACSMPARPIVRRALTHQCEAMAANLRMDFPTKEAQP